MSTVGILSSSFQFSHNGPDKRFGGLFVKSG